MPYGAKKRNATASCSVEGEVAIGVRFASEVRMILSFEVQPAEGRVADPLVASTEAMIPQSPWPLWVSDGWDAYGEALYRRHAVWVHFPRTGRPGRPKEPKLLPHPLLRYGQAVKVRNQEVRPRMVYGKAKRSLISTWGLERQNLNFRHENRRLTRISCFLQIYRRLEESTGFVSWLL